MFATMVGMTAVVITAATRLEYCDKSMMPCFSPNSAAMVPKVKPVDISRLVYMASLVVEPKYFATGKIPPVLEKTLTMKKKTVAPGAAISAGSETSEPTRMKKNGV